jgi:hypothetical protein
MGNICSEQPKVNVDHESLTQNNDLIEPSINYDE